MKVLLTIEDHPEMKALVEKIEVEKEELKGMVDAIKAKTKYIKETLWNGIQEHMVKSGMYKDRDSIPSLSLTSDKKHVISKEDECEVCGETHDLENATDVKIVTSDNVEELLSDSNVPAKVKEVIRKAVSDGAKIKYSEEAIS